MPDDAEAQEHLDAEPSGARGVDQQTESAGENEAEAAAGGGEPSEDETPGARIARLEGEVSSLMDQYLRKSADFDNYRKRMLREREEHSAYATRELLNDLLPVIDDFERAIRSADESNDFTAFHDGVIMIEKQLVSLLERKWKLVRFDSSGEEFDPQRHEAVIAEERQDIESAVVLEDFQKGYLLHDRVLRPAKVKVAVPASGRTSQETGARQENGER